MKIRVVRCLLPLVAMLFLAACSNDKESASTEPAPDVTAEMQAFYKDNPTFFSFKTLANLPADLVWENGADLPDIGSPEAKKGGTFNFFLSHNPYRSSLV